VIAPDLPGFGESTCDHGSRYGHAEQVDRIDKFIDALGLDAVHIGGNSMGGYLAGLYTAAHAEKVKSLWMLAPAGVASAETSELMQCLDRGENPLLVQSKADFERLADLCFTKLPYVPKVFQKCLCERSIANRPFQSKIFEEIFSDPVELESALSGSDVPAQIVWGDGDRLLHFSGAAILAKAMNNATAVLMERMGHCPMLERPQETAELFLAFRATG
jgi:pimeloyl-ACP methyl ester carboxylesterase